jgi:hypothetical protein
MSDEDLRALCVDCGVETLPLDEGRAEWYHVHPEVWEASGLGPDDGCLCIGCLETRLQRRLTPADFSDAGINDLSISDTPRYAWSYRTPRLVARLKGEQ